MKVDKWLVRINNILGWGIGMHTWCCSNAYNVYNIGVQYSWLRMHCLFRNYLTTCVTHINGAVVIHQWWRAGSREAATRESWLEEERQPPGSKQVCLQLSASSVLDSVWLQRDTCSADGKASLHWIHRLTHSTFNLVECISVCVLWSYSWLAGTERVCWKECTETRCGSLYTDR